MHTLHTNQEVDFTELVKNSTNKPVSKQTTVTTRRLRAGGDSVYSVATIYHPKCPICNNRKKNFKTCKESGMCDSHTWKKMRQYKLLLKGSKS